MSEVSYPEALNKIEDKDIRNSIRGFIILLFQEHNKELVQAKLGTIKIIVEYKNPYPKDVFTWSNKEKLDFNRGRFNQHCFEVVENMRNNFLKELKRGGGGE